MESLFNSVITNTTIQYSTFFITISLGLLLGIVIGAVYYFSNQKQGSQNMTLVLAVLPALMAVVILLVGNNVAGAFSLAGVFSIIRFRSVPGSGKDILYILFCVVIGLCCGFEIYPLAIILTAIICLALIIFAFTLQRNLKKQLELRILVPENLSNEESFNEILEQYTSSYFLNKIRTRELGSVYEFNYVIFLQQSVSKRELIDRLRCRNGNLNITLSLVSDQSEM